MQVAKKRIIENFFSLSLINGINVVIPLIILPYLIKTIGINSYGVYSIAYAMIQYVILLSNYGFGFSATKQIAQNRENTDYVNKIFNSVILSRIGIAFVGSIIFAIISYYSFSKEYLIMFLFGLGMVVGDILNPTWFYQGMERMKFMTIVNLISKVVFTICIFIFIKSENDCIYITLLNSLGYIVAGIASLIFVLRYFNIKLQLPKFEDVKFQIKSGWYIFLSTISMSLYRESNILILGFFTNEASVGIYSGAEKIIKAAQSVTNPIANALFPYVSKSFKSLSVTNKIQSIKCLSIKIGCVLCLGTIFIFMVAPIATRLLLDDISDTATSLIRIMSPIIFFGGLNYVLGIIGLVNMDEEKSFLRFVMISGIISIVFLLSTVKWWDIYSASYAMVLTEILLFILCILKLKSIKINLLNDRHNNS